MIPGAPDAILLPGSLGAASVQQLSAKLAVREAKFALPDGETRVIEHNLTTDVHFSNVCIDQPAELGF